jgi:hypothetical protein
VSRDPLPPDGPHPGGAAAPPLEDELRALARRVDEIHARVVARTSSETLALVELLGSRRRLMTVNFVAGLARGIGMFLGVTIVGAILLGVAAYAFDTAFETLGLQNVTLRSTVTSAYGKYVEIQSLINEAQRSLDAAQTAVEKLPEAAASPTPAAGG